MHKQQLIKVMTQGINLSTLDLDEDALESFVKTLLKFLGHNLHHLFFYRDDKQNNIFYDHNNQAGTFYLFITSTSLEFRLMDGIVSDAENAGLIAIQTVKYMAVLFDEIDRLRLKEKDLAVVLDKLNPKLDEESTEDKDDDDSPDFEWV